MTFALDVNPLVYVVDSASPHYDKARELFARLDGSDELVYLFWPVIFGFLRISTDSRVLSVPLAPAEALGFVRNLLALTQVRSGTEPDGFLDHLEAVTAGLFVRGAFFSDVHIVALMRHYGVNTIYSHDRDFRKFDGIRVVDPFV